MYFIKACELFWKLVVILKKKIETLNFLFLNYKTVGNFLMFCDTKFFCLNKTWKVIGFIKMQKQFLEIYGNFGNMEQKLLKI